MAELEPGVRVQLCSGNPFAGERVEPPETPRGGCGGGGWGDTVVVAGPTSSVGRQLIKLLVESPEFGAVQVQPCGRGACTAGGDLSR
jgi:hypothetical protein